MAANISSRISPSPLQMPLVPLSLASVITLYAPASKSRLIDSSHNAGVSAIDLAASFEPTSLKTLNSFENSAIYGTFPYWIAAGCHLRFQHIRMQTAGSIESTDPSFPGWQTFQIKCRRKRRQCRFALGDLFFLPSGAKPPMSPSRI